MAASPDFAAARPPPAWRARVSAFWFWWTGELAQVARAKMGGFPGLAPASPIAIEEDALVRLEVRGAAVVESARSPLGSLDPEGCRLALRSLVGAPGGQAARVRLCLAREESLLRRISLPLATEENLAQVLAFEMDRLSPFSAESVYFAHRVASRDAAAGKLQVDLGIARRDIVDAALARLRSWGANVEAVVLADDLTRSKEPLDLLPVSQRGGGVRGRARTAQWIAALVVVALLGAALVVPLWQKRQAVIALLPTEAKAKVEAEATDKLSRELEKMVADHNFLLAKKHTGTTALSVVEELTRLLPDTTWVQQLDVRTAAKVREVQISGEAPSCPKLIEILEPSTRLANATPRGACTRGSQPGTERFLIAAEVRPRPLPEAVPASQAAIAPAPARAAPAPAAPPPDTAKLEPGK